MSSIAHLEDRTVISVSGPEAKTFLQGLLTNDVASLVPDQPIYAALLTPQGKILFDMIVLEHGNEILLDCESSSADALSKKLAMYRLRAKVTIARRDDLAVVAGWGAAAAGSDFSFPDPRLADLGRRAIVEVVHVPESIGRSKDYQERRVQLGVPEGRDFGNNTMFALDADLDELHAISFDKGCYVGQELTARMKHRGAARKRLLPVSALGSSKLPEPAALVLSGNTVLGEITSAYGARGFALIRLDRMKEHGATNLSCGDARVEINVPSWLAF